MTLAREPPDVPGCTNGERRCAKGYPLDDATLIEEARRGNIRAYGDLVLRYQDLAFRTAVLLLRDAAEADDVIQEAFVKAYRALPRFRPGAPFRPWLLTIVANEARNWQVSARRRARLTQRLEGALPHGAEAPSPEDAALAEERRAVLLQTVDLLPPMDRLVIACRYFLDLTEAETAAMLACPRGTVKSRLSRALERLRAALAASEGDDRAVHQGVAREH
jgi:RNA polymerase sigma-70 factor (ECF subfamily)